VIASEVHLSAGQRNAHAQGWLISILVHGTVAFVAILLVKQIQLVPQDDAFKWNVAMVLPTQSIQPTALPQKQAPTRSASSATSSPSSQLQATAPEQISPSTQLTHQMIPSDSEGINTPVLTEAHSTRPSEPIRYETVASMDVSSDSATRPAPSSSPSATLEQIDQSDQTPAPTQMATISPVQPEAPTRRDYGWLSEAILRRVEELKRYPASARVDRAEGKVVVRAVINEDGSIGEVEVFQSSGHAGLDKAAVETMRQAAPFNLPRPLEQPRMTIKIPMSYRLDR
jgi:protein TonB